MSSLNLTEVEAQERARLISNCAYDITVDVTGGDAAVEDPQATFPSRTVITFDAAEAGNTFLDLRAERVERVLLDGVDITATAVPLDAEGNYDEERGLQLELTPGHHEVEVSAHCRYSNTGQGLHRFLDPADQRTYFYTQCQTADAKRIFACFDQPDLKATYRTTVIAPAEWLVVGNNTVEVTALPDGTRSHTNVVDYPLSTYLFALCIGDWYEVRDSWSGELVHHPETPADQPERLTVPFGIYCRKSLAEHLDQDTIFRETKQGFDFYHANFGMAYPFHKYDQIFCPEYNMGAMENAGCVTFRDEYVFSSRASRQMYERRCDTILHELAHMWFGDLVTMKWWGDLWLNESFATWSAAISQAEATEFTTAWVTFTAVEKTWAYAQDTLPTTHPIFADATDIETVEQNFDGITYAKGASVLKQLQAYVGRDAFFAGVRRHFANHAFGNATFDDLLGALEQASGRDLSTWSDQWLKTTGVNTLSPEFTEADGHYTAFTINQSGAQPGAGEYRTHRLAVGLYNLVDGKLTRTLRVELDVEGPTTEVPALVGQPVADLVLINDDDLAYALIELDEKSKETLINHIGDIESPMARALLWNAAWEATRNQQMRARDFITLVARGIANETEIGPMSRVLLNAEVALNSYADPEWAEAEGKTLLVDALLDTLKGLPAESDQQLPLIQSLSRIGGIGRAQQLFESILAGAPAIDGTPLAGVTVDAELRWRAITALASAGHLADVAATVEEERRRDTSASGRNWAWTATAAATDAAAKHATFQELLTKANTISNLELRHKAMGLTWGPGCDLLADVAPQYFAQAPAIWRDFSSEVANETLEMLYPAWVVTPAAIGAAEVLLSSEHPAGLKRIIAEGQARVKRSRDCRAFDAS